MKLSEMNLCGAYFEITRAIAGVDTKINDIKKRIGYNKYEEFDLIINSLDLLSCINIEILRKYRHFMQTMDEEIEEAYDEPCVCKGNAFTLLCDACESNLKRERKNETT